jgi:PAS domain S-box-containing protein
MSKIAFIAPYEEIYQIGKRVVSDLQLTDKIDCYLGWMGEGVKIARKLESDGVEVIISRGGTAELITFSDVKVPVVELPISFQDLADTLLKVKAVTTVDRPRIAVLAFKNMVQNIDVFARVMDLNLTVYELRSEEDISLCVDRAIKTQADVIIGGYWTTIIAAEAGFPTILLTSGEDSYRSAVQQAEQIAYARSLEKERMQKFRALVDYSIQGIIGIDHNRRISVFNNAAERLLGLCAQNMIGKKLHEVLPVSPFHIDWENAEAITGEIVQLNGKKFIANVIPIDIGGAVSGMMITIEDIGRIVELEANIRNGIYSKGLYAQYRFSDIDGNSPQIRETKRIAQEYAKTDATVLISGASGTGKELFAQSIHNASKRQTKPFIAVNCGAIPANLMESELFGYAEGAFTGAMRKGKPGLFELAHGGTIFLDEISEMDKLAQTTLLRVIQERRIMRVGGDRYLPIDVRIIAATNRPLSQMVADGLLREDLYYRLNVLPLDVPPLKDRQGDALFIARKFLDYYNKMFGKQLVFSKEAEDFIETYDWPGNIRQLRNYVERLVVITKGNIIRLDTAADIGAPPFNSTAADSSCKPIHLDTTNEKNTIVSVLAQTGYNQKEAAKKLGIDRTTLYRKMRTYNITIKKQCD